MLKITEMTVYGHVISSSVQAHAIHDFLLQANTDAKTARDLEAALVKNGAAKGGAAYRGADRLIQKLRKAKMISLDKRAWRTTSTGLELAQNLTELYNFTDAMDTK